MTTKGKLTLISFLTLDGIMQAPGAPEEDRSDNFEHGGWQPPLVDEEFGRIENASIQQADAFLLGRRTYDIFASYWPKVTDPENLVATTLNQRPKYVVSRSLKQADWKGTSIIRSDVAKEVEKLKRQYSREIQIFGSGDLVRTLLAENLLDVLHLWIHPVILGTGKRLFPSGSAPTALKLVNSERISTGAMLHTYHPAGKPTYGSF